METTVSDVADMIVSNVESLKGVEANEHVVCQRRQLVMTQVTATTTTTTDAAAAAAAMSLVTAIQHLLDVP